MNVGDKFTVPGIYEKVPNPRRRWWTPWRKRFVPGPRLQVFTVVVTDTGADSGIAARWPLRS